MVLYFGVIHIYVLLTMSSKFKKEYLELSVIPSVVIHANPLFKHLQLLSLPSQYIFSLLVFVLVIKNRGLFQSN